jgi:hypothetical protein
MSSREGGDAMRKTKQRKANPVILRRQREVIREVMLSAGQCATWLTLDELAKLTHYPPASISAQLRHLRKPQNGAHTLVKRCRTLNKGHARGRLRRCLGILRAARAARAASESEA